jgi:hypothetical protein
LVLVGGAAGGWLYFRTRQAPQPALSAYANPAVCTGCHADIAATYRKTGMGRSFARMDVAKAPPFGKPFYNKTSDS